MALDIKTSLDAVKRQALLVILKSVKVPYVNISNDLFTYISNDSNSFNTLLSRMNFNAAVFSSTQVSAMYLLAYLDFYALYTIMVSNYGVFNSLKTVSEGKYKYIYNLYKELYRTITTKQILQDYAYGFYNNFLYPKDINAASSKVVTRSGKLTNVLETYPAVTLPAKKLKEVLPTSLTFFSDDTTISEVNTDSDTNFLKYSVLRYQNNKISLVSNIMPAKDGISYSRVTPEITGAIAGYFTDTIYVNCTVSERDSKDKAVIKLQGSTNNYDWSSDFQITPGTPAKIMIEGDIEIGLNITLYDHSSLAVNDRWIISVIHSDVQPPTIDLVARFGILEPISFITYMDTSAHKLDIVSSVIRARRFDADETPAKVFDGRIGHVAVTNGPVNSYRTRLIQTNFDIKSKGGRLANEYDFKVTDIKGYQCQYEPHGAVTFNPVAVDGITSAALEADTFVPSYGVWDAESTLDVKLPQSFIEFNVVAETKLSKAVIPMLPKNFLKRFTTTLVPFHSSLPSVIANTGDMAIVFGDIVVENNGTYVKNEVGDWKKFSEDKSGYLPMLNEYVVPTQIDIINEMFDFGSAWYTPRFPVDTGYVINALETSQFLLAYDNYLRGIAQAYNYNIDSNNIIFGHYTWKDGYSIAYPVKLWSISDCADNNKDNGKWVAASNNIYYLFYFDEYNDVHLALREYDQGTKILKNFTGNLYGQIEMRSMDKTYITPMVFDYKLEYI